MKTVDALALGMLLLQGCRGDTGTGPPRVALVEVSPAASPLTALGETRQLSAVPKDAAGNPMSGFTITWTSVQAISRQGRRFGVGHRRRERRRRDHRRRRERAGLGTGRREAADRHTPG